MATHEPQTVDDRLIETLIDTLPRLDDIGDGPELDADTLRAYEQMDVEKTAGTAYGDHLRDIRSWIHDLADELRGYGQTELVTIENHFEYDTPECDFLVEEQPLLHWSESLVTSVDDVDDFDEDREEAYVSYRVADLRNGGNAKLFELHVSYYITGEVHAALEVTPGYEVEPARSGGDRLVSTFVFDRFLRHVSIDDAIDELREMRPFVLSRVMELVGEQDVNLSHARAKALAEAGVDNGTIAERLDIGEGAVRSYKSKFMRDTRNAERRVIGNKPVAKDILAVHEFDVSNYLGERWYICRTTLPDPMGLANPYSLIVVKEDYDSFDITFDVSTTNYASLDALIDAVYVNGEFHDERRAEDVRAAIEAIPKHELDATDIGALPKPTETLHAEVP